MGIHIMRMFSVAHLHTLPCIPVAMTRMRASAMAAMQAKVTVLDASEVLVVLRERHDAA